MSTKNKLDKIIYTYMENTKPQLIEPGIKTFLKHSLKKCHEFKMNYYNSITNVSLLVGFCLFVSLLLYIKYKGKPTEEELEEKENQKKHYIIQKIKNYRDAKRIAHQELITGLPEFSY
jgi:hypothetical protein